MDVSASEFSAEYSRAAPAVYAWLAVHLHGALRREVDPEDLLQEVAVRAFEARERFDLERGAFRGWLFGIARNVLMQVLERLGSEPSSRREWLTTGGLERLPDEATSITKSLARDDGMQAFLTKLEDLDPGERRLVVHRGLEGLPFAGIGELLGEDAKTIQKRWERLCARLREGDSLSRLLVV